MKENYQKDEFLQRRRERQKKARQRRAKATIIFLLVLLLIIGAVLSVTVLFPIKNISASGSKIYTASQIVEACGIKKGENLIVASESKTLYNLKSKLPFVETVKLEKTFPDSIKVIVTDAKEYASYKVGKKYYTVSESGWVLASYKKQPKGMMLIISDKVKCNVGESLEFSDKGMKDLSENILANLNKHKLLVEYVDITDKAEITAKIDGRFIVNFGSSADFESKVKHLLAMMEEIGENDTGKINLSMWNSQNTQGAFVKTDIK